MAVDGGPQRAWICAIINGSASFSTGHGCASSGPLIMQDSPSELSPAPAAVGRPADPLPGWFQTPRGRYVLAWEQRQYDNAVDDIFG